MASFRLGTCERKPWSRIGGIDGDGLPKQWQRFVLPALECVDLRESQAGAEKSRPQVDGLLQEADALGEALLLEPNGAQHRVRGRSSVGVSKREAGLLIRFVQAALLNEQGRLLKCVARIGAESCRGRQDAAKKQCARRLDRISASATYSPYISFQARAVSPRVPIRPSPSRSRT